MDFNIDGAFGVLKDELIALFMQVGGFFTENLQIEVEVSSKTYWFIWIFVFILSGFFLALLRQKGFIPTFNKDRTFEQEDEAQEIALFTQRLVMKDELINSELQNIEAEKSKHEVDKLQNINVGIRRRSSYFLKLLTPESDRFSRTPSFAQHGEFEGIQSSISFDADTSGDKKVEVSVLLDSNSRKYK